MRIFGDSFDVYTNTSDLALRYSSASTYSLLTAGSTAFGTGQGLACANGTNLQASWETASNETTVYFSIRIKYASGVSDGTKTLAITLRDAANDQVSVVMAGDGSIAIRSGGTGGSHIGASPYAAQFLLNTWDSWQVKCVINNTTGSVEVRKDGSAVAAFTPLANVNTRAGSANATVSGFTVTSNSAYWLLDDIWFNSGTGAPPTTWPGDVRFKQMIVSSQSACQFSISPTVYTFGEVTSSGTRAITQNVLTTTKAFVANASGTVTQIVLQMNAGFTGSAIMGLYDNTGAAGAPGAVLATTAAVSNPSVGSNSFTFASPPTVKSGSTYYLALLTNAACTTKAGAPATGYTVAQSYGSGMPNPATGISGASVADIAAVASIVPFNWFLVSDATEDGDASYTYSSTVGNKDIYGFSVGALGVTPAAILGANLFVYWKKSDSGSRSGTIGMDANGSGDTAQLINSTPSLSYTYAQKWMPTDPTGAAWTVTTLESSKPSITVAS